MAQLDYSAPAEVFAFRQTGQKRSMTHRRFSNAAEALRFAVEELPPSANAVLEIDEERFQGAALRQMYDHADYPLVRTPR